MTIDYEWNLVRDFHRIFSHPIADQPKLLGRERAISRCAWMREEIDEFETATDVYGQADAMIDLIYFALGTLVEMGVKPSEAFAIVHEANMTKVWPDGSLRYREDGKTIKPPGWLDPFPRLKKAIDAQASDIKTEAPET